MVRVRKRSPWLPSALAVVIGVLVRATSGQAPTSAPSSVASPRLRKLEAAIASGEAKALDAFWEEVKRDGAPLVEPAASESERLVTFLFRSSAETRVLLLADWGDYVPRLTFQRLAGTDVWHRSFSLPADARFLYELSVDDPNYPFTDTDPMRFPSAVQPDPLNPNRYDFAKPHILSIVALPKAPSLELSTRNPVAPQGTVTRLEPKLTSAILGNERDVFVYKPHDYRDAASGGDAGRDKGEPYPLLLFPASYINQVRLPTILDNLIARGRIPPVVAVFVGFPRSAPGQNAQDEEAGGDPPFADFIAKELLPWVRERVRVTSDPRRVVLGGASAGGHSAGFVALRHPEAVGNVLAQSGAFWRGIGHSAGYWSDPAREEGREGFARFVASRPGPAAPVRFHLTIGRLESRNALDAGFVTMLHATRHVRDVLQAKGYDVTLRESNGGHDPYNWEASLPDALVALLGAPAKPKDPPDRK